jgi:hypothetical protein
MIGKRLSEGGVTVVVGTPVTYTNAMVRWTFEFSTSWLGYLYTGGADFIDTNNYLAYAYGGASVSIDGTVIGVDWGKEQDGLIWCNYLVQASVTINDNYTFDSYWQAQLDNSYAQAMYLQQSGACSPFNNTTTFTTVYSVTVPYFCGPNCFSGSP